MTLDELAVMASEPPSELRRWNELGLVHAPEGDSIRAELERVRLIRFALNRGYTAEKLADIASSHGDLVGHFAERMAATTGPPVCTLDEAAADVGIDPVAFEPLRNAAGLRGQPQAYQEDIEAIRSMKAALEAGMETGLLVQILRVIAGGTERSPTAPPACSISTYMSSCVLAVRRELSSCSRRTSLAIG
jgi:hypothetical protein